MPVIEIKSIDDPRIAVYRDLPRSRRAKQSGVFIAEGALLVGRLLASDFEVASVFVEPARLPEFAAQTAEHVPIYVADRALFQTTLGFNFHRCVLACGRRRQNPSLGEVAARLPPAAVVLACDAVHDPENLGGVLRNCAAFGVNAVLLGPRCADAYSRRVLRVSMGTAFKLTIVESDDLVRDLASLKCEQGFSLVATVLDRRALPLERATRPQRAALLLGNEAHGLDAGLVAQSDQRVTIPMRNDTDSLNVAVASGIFLHHFTRQFDEA